MGLFDKGVAGAPGLVHPGNQRGHKQRRRVMGRARLYAKHYDALYEKADAASANSVHTPSDLKTRRGRPQLSIAYDPNGGIKLVRKADPYHDDQGRFTSADGASGGGGSAAPASFTGTRAAGEAAGSVAGTYAGQYAGGALGGAIGSLIGPEGTVAGAGVGKFVGGWAGGLAGDYVGRRIAEAVYGAANPGFKAPSQTLGSEVAGGVGGLAGFALGGPLGRAAGEAAGAAGAATMTAAEATARALGQAAGDVAGTRFGDYAASRVGGVLADTQGSTAARYGSDVLTDAAADAVLNLGKAARRTLGDGPMDQVALRGGGMERPMIGRDDLNSDPFYLQDAKAGSRFRALMAQRDADATTKQVQLGFYARRVENIQHIPGEAAAAFRARMNQQLPAQLDQQGPYPWRGAKRRRLFGDDDA